MNYAQLLIFIIFPLFIDELHFLQNGV